MPRLLFTVLCAVSVTFAQNFPIILGAQLEAGSGTLPHGQSGTGLVRATPYVGAWLQGLGFVRLGASLWSSSLVDTNGVDHGWEERDIGLTLGVSLGGLGRPVLLGSYTQCQSFTESGDANWREWGMGVGTSFLLSPSASLNLEIEHRWVTEHYIPTLELYSQGRRMQIHLGFSVFLL